MRQLFINVDFKKANDNVYLDILQTNNVQSVR